MAILNIIWCTVLILLVWLRILYPVSVLCFIIGLGRSVHLWSESATWFCQAYTHLQICDMMRPMMNESGRARIPFPGHCPGFLNACWTADILEVNRKWRPGGDWTTSTLFRSHPCSLLIPAYTTHPTFNVGGGEERGAAREIDDTGQWVSRAGEPVEHRKHSGSGTAPPPPLASPSMLDNRQEEKSTYKCCGFCILGLPVS